MSLKGHEFKRICVRFIIFIFLTCLSALAKDKASKELKKMDINLSTPRVYEPASVDFRDNLNNSLARFLEQKNGVDSTTSNLDFANESFELHNLNLLFDYKNSSFLLQKDLFVKKDSTDYSAGLINRYENHNFLFGLNSFFDEVSEKKSYSFGSELGFGNFFKAYSNYYVLDDAPQTTDMKKDNLELGVNFALPKNLPFELEFSKDNEKLDYGVSYKAFSMFDVRFLKQDYKNDTPNSTNLYLNFKYDLNKGFFKQLKPERKPFERIHRYDFLRHSNF